MHKTVLQQSASAVAGATVAVHDFSLDYARLVPIIPCQLRAGPYEPTIEREREGVESGEWSGGSGGILSSAAPAGQDNVACAFLSLSAVCLRGNPLRGQKRRGSVHLHVIHVRVEDLCSHSQKYIVLLTNIIC